MLKFIKQKFKKSSNNKIIVTLYELDIKIKTLNNQVIENVSKGMYAENNKMFKETIEIKQQLQQLQKNTSNKDLKNHIKELTQSLWIIEVHAKGPIA